MQGRLASYQASQKRLVDRDGRPLSGFLTEPSGPVAGAVVIVHDFFGLSPAMKSVATRLSNEGFVGYAPDLYRGEVATTRERALELVSRLAWNSVAIELALAVGALKAARPNVRVAIIGFAMGGAAALVAAASVPAISAAVTFYGIPQDVTLENPGVRVQGHFAVRDKKCTPDRVAALSRSLGERSIPHEFHSYDADNGFFNPARPETYSQADASRSWVSTLAFLRESLALTRSL
jgi:carboxymethylenebutenolidase